MKHDKDDKPQVPRATRWDKAKIGRVAKLIAIILLCIAAIILFRKMQQHDFFRATRQVDAGSVTVSDLSPVQQLKVMSVYKEILVHKTKYGPVMGMPELVLVR